MTSAPPWTQRRKEKNDGPGNQYCGAKALKAYASAASEAAYNERNSGLFEYAMEIERLAWRAENHENRRTPD